MSLSKKKKKKMGKSYPFFAAKAAKQQARQINKGGVNKGKVNVLPQTRSKRLPQTRSKRRGVQLHGGLAESGISPHS